MTTCEIVAYVAALVLFPFVVQLLMIPVLLVADLLDRMIERRKRR